MGKALVVTRISHARYLTDKSRMEELAPLQRRHMAICRYISDLLDTEIVHQGVSSVCMISDDEASGVEIAIKILSAHRRWTGGTKPPEISVAVCSGDFSLKEGSITGKAYYLGMEILKSSGPWELVIDSRISQVWNFRGNRHILNLKREISLEGTTEKVFLIDWDSHSIEPKKNAILRGFGHVTVLLIPPIAAIFILILTMGIPARHKGNSFILWGPFGGFDDNEKNCFIPKELKKNKNIFCFDKYTYRYPPVTGSTQVTGRRKTLDAGYLYELEISDISSGKILGAESGKLSTGKFEEFIEKVKIFVNKKPELSDKEKKRICEGLNEEVCIPDLERVN
ncbi:MAG: hypothetical protein JXR95_07970 [Deltaproteobacteria bacterium]|nr:hypothetical protein [Deltaproteobacteria bacterium]